MTFWNLTEEKIDPQHKLVTQFISTVYATCMFQTIINNKFDPFLLCFFVSYQLNSSQTNLEENKKYEYLVRKPRKI